MYKEELAAVGKSAEKKVSFLKENPLGYFLLSMLAGLFIGLGCILMGVVGGTFSAAGSYAVKLVNGLVFSVGLCLVTMAGAELFTGNNFVLSVGAMTKTVSWGSAAKLWGICWLGNLVGSVLTAALFSLTGIASGDIGTYLAQTAFNKMTGNPSELFFKGIFCNICVCLAIWCGFRLKSEGAKIAMNILCVVTFVACGFEHCVANMTFLTIGLINPAGLSMSLSGALMNLLVVTIGNMTGGILFVALPYALIGREK